MGLVNIDYIKVPNIVKTALDQNIDKPLREIMKVTFTELKKQNALYIDSIENIYHVPGINNMVANIIEKSYFDQIIGTTNSAGDQAKEDLISLVLMHDIRIKTKNIPTSIVDKDHNYIKRDLSPEYDTDGTIIPQLALQLDVIRGVILGDAKPYLGRAIFFQLMLAERFGILSIPNVLNTNIVSQAKVLEKNITIDLLQKIQDLYPSSYQSEQITDQTLNQWKMEKISQICAICLALLVDENMSLEDDKRTAEVSGILQHNSDVNQYLNRCIAQCNNDINRVNAISITSSLKHKGVASAITALLTTKPEDIKNLLIQLIDTSNTNTNQSNLDAISISSQTKSFIKEEKLRNEVVRIKNI